MVLLYPPGNDPYFEELVKNIDYIFYSDYLLVNLCVFLSPRTQACAISLCWTMD